MLGVFLFSGVASAQTNDLPSAGATPGSPFYFLDRFFEGVGTFFTFGEANKARRYLALAGERLAEAQALAEEQDADNIAEATELYEEQLAEAKERASRTGELDLEAQVTDATTKHLSVLDDVISRVPEQAREQVMAAKGRTVSGQIEALRGIAQRDPGKAVDIFARAAEGRLNAANARANRGADEDEAEEVEDALAEYDKYAQFGQEISGLAQGIGTGETAVEDLVKRATSHHLQVLEDVRQKLPPQAKQEFQRALDSAREVQQLRPAIPAQQQGQPGVQQQRQTPSGQPTPAPVQLPPQSQQRGNDEQEVEVENGAGGPPQGIPGGPTQQTPGGRP